MIKDNGLGVRLKTTTARLCHDLKILSISRKYILSTRRQLAKYSLFFFIFFFIIFLFFFIIICSSPEMKAKTNDLIV